MSYIVDWINKIVSVPTADLTLVGETRYSLDMADFLAEVRRLEWEFTGGLWAPPILNHTNTKVDFAGSNYAPFDEILNDYQVEFTGLATRVDLIGSNNNIIDVLIDNCVSVVPSNSTGLQIISVGSGLSIEQDIRLTNIEDLAESDEEKNVVDNKYYKRHKTTKVVLKEKDYVKDVDNNETLIEP